MVEFQHFEPALRARANDRCELCDREAGLEAHAVAGGPAPTLSADSCVLVCDLCRAQLDGDAPLDPNHWRCLQSAAWSEVAAVQVASVRLLGRLPEQPWAVELLDSVYLDDETRAWAEAEPVGAGATADIGSRTLDSNGVELADGDAVTLIKDLDVKGAGFVAKRGTLVKGIRLTGDPEHVEGRVNKVAIVLKTRFLKRA
jgi:protein PhnA